MKRTVVVALALVAAWQWAGAASASSPDAVGWWRDTSVPAPIEPAPSVPDGGLYVANRVTGPSAVAAARFSIPTGATARSLTLTVSASEGDVALIACPATSPWTAAHGGAWADRPTTDCAAGHADGELSDDGARVTFSLPPAMVRGALDVVIEPAVDAAIFTVVFARPTDDALATSAPVTAAAAPASTTVVAGTNAFAAPSPPANIAIEPVMPLVDAAVAAATAVPPPIDYVSSSPESVVSTATLSGTKRAIAVAIAVLMLALLVWINRVRMLVRVAELAAPHLDTGATERVAGVGRFARTRGGSAPPL